MAALLLLVAGILNGIYLVQFHRLMKLLERSAQTYWAQIGRPHAFSGKDVSVMLNNLYSRGMSEAAAAGRFPRVLDAVRLLLPVTTVVTLAAMILLGNVLNEPAA